MVRSENCFRILNYFIVWIF